MDHTGLQKIKRQRLHAFIARLNRELKLVEPYPKVKARLMALRIKAQLALEEL